MRSVLRVCISLQCIPYCVLLRSTKPKPSAWGSVRRSPWGVESRAPQRSRPGGPRAAGAEGAASPSRVPSARSRPEVQAPSGAPRAHVDARLSPGLSRASQISVLQLDRLQHVGFTILYKYVSQGGKKQKKQQKNFLVCKNLGSSRLFEIHHGLAGGAFLKETERRSSQTGRPRRGF